MKIEEAIVGERVFLGSESGVKKVRQWFKKAELGSPGTIVRVYPGSIDVLFDGEPVCWCVAPDTVEYTLTSPFSKTSRPNPKLLGNDFLLI